MSKFGKNPTFWRKLTDDQIETLITLENEKEKGYWDNWQKIIKGMLK